MVRSLSRPSVPGPQKRSTYIPWVLAQVTYLDNPSPSAPSHPSSPRMPQNYPLPTQSRPTLVSGLVPGRLFAPSAGAQASLTSQPARAVGEISQSPMKYPRNIPMLSIKHPCCRHDTKRALGSCTAVRVRGKPVGVRKSSETAGLGWPCPREAGKGDRYKAAR